MRFLVWLFTFLLLPAANAAPVYNVTDLGEASNYTHMGLNNRGQTAFVAANNRLYRYTDGTGRESLGDFLADPFYVSINDLGQVAGQTHASTDPFRSAAFRYTDGVGLEILDTTSKSYAAGINNRGDVAVQNTGGLFLYTDEAGLTRLSDFPTRANSMNNAGLIVGETGMTPTEAFAYIPGQGISLLGSQIGGPGEAFGVSNAGFITGRVHASGVWRGFRLAPDRSVTYIEGINPIAAVDVNDSGHVVGFGAFPGGQVTAFLYTDAFGAQDLNSLIDPAAQWRLGRALAINEWGQIAGTGFYRGQFRAFRLDPVNPIPEPGTLALLSIAGIGMLRRRRRT